MIVTKNMKYEKMEVMQGQTYPDISRDMPISNTASCNQTLIQHDRFSKIVKKIGYHLEKCKLTLK